MTLQLDFRGKTALVTGGTRGIGAAIAQHLYEAGAELILTGTDQSKTSALNEAVMKEGKRGIHYLPADFSNEASTTRFLAEIGDRRIDVCINNAGTNRIDLIDETQMDDYELLSQVNLKAPFRIIRQVNQSMKQCRYGRIINIASIWSVITKAKRAIYSTTKAGLLGMTRAAAVELAPFNVLVNAVSPGFTMTELTAAVLSPQEIEALGAQVPAGRFATPDEIAKSVLFLASDLNTYITGQNIVIDGGFVCV
ncbi:MAG: SDR family oxidoreductase [Desulfobacteraceae bacterium]|nr:SDR family oxidoreductase [Desulfobacteraceae bacterium]